jgi:cytochrome d ubiquinol oxidase subunit II
MTLETVWFLLVAFMLATYVLLDGFDLGAGIMHLFVARTEQEREAVLRSVGPVWDGNEVWLIAGGGTLYFAFPTLYSTSFSGFYLPLIIVLWLLVFRALGIELRHQLHHPVWTDFWDVAFAGASLLLAVFFGAALGNVVRGVTFDGAGRFFAPLWTDFRVSGRTGILDWYTVLVAVHATVALTVHGAAWVAWRTAGTVHTRCLRALRYGWVPLALLTGATTAATFVVQPRLAQNLAAYPWGLAVPAIAVAGLAAIPWFVRKGRPDRTFFASGAYVLGMLGSAAYGIYPYVLPGRAPGEGLTIQTAATEPYGLAVGLAWWIPGMVLALGYFVFLYRRLPTGIS